MKTVFEKNQSSKRHSLAYFHRGKTNRRVAGRKEERKAGERQGGKKGGREHSWKSRSVVLAADLNIFKYIVLFESLRFLNWI